MNGWMDGPQSTRHGWLKKTIIITIITLEDMCLIQEWQHLIQLTQNWVCKGKN